MIRWANFDKRIELIVKASYYINEVNKLNSSCNSKHHERKRRQIDSAMITATDFALKQLQGSILNERIVELKNLNVENLSPKSRGECYLIQQN